MRSIEFFQKRRLEQLLPPVGDSSLTDFLETLAVKDSDSRFISEIYGVFNGERDWGAWFPGYRIDSIEGVVDLMSSTQDSWEILEDKTGAEHFMRKFVPIISSVSGSSIGPIIGFGGEFHSQVIEYNYDSGEIRCWSRTEGQFLEAFFFLAAEKPFHESLAFRMMPYLFSENDIGFLRKWDNIRYPVSLEPTLNVFD
jgi:hypothetical protein